MCEQKTDQEKMIEYTLGENWDKKVRVVLNLHNLNEEQQNFVVGLLVEHRQAAYLQGYKRGYNQGEKNGK